MNAPLPANLKYDLSALITAIAHGHADDRLAHTLQPAQWDALAPYLQPVTLAQGQVLFSHGDKDRTLYLVESGNLSVHYEDVKGRVRLALVGPGAVVGEAGFFSHRPRRATVHAGNVCRLWGLTPARFTELSNRLPEIALALTLASSGVMARRLGNRLRRIAST